MECFSPNATDPFAISTPFFEGQALFLLRSPKQDIEDPRRPHQFAHIFRGKQRTLEVQVQGRFKRLPRGEVGSFIHATSATVKIRAEIVFLQTGRQAIEYRQAGMFCER